MYLCTYVPCNQCVHVCASLCICVCVCVILMSIMLEFAKSFTVERECSLPASSSKFTAFQLWSRLLPFLFIILSRVVFVAYAPKHQHTTHYIYTIGFTPVTSLSQRARRLFFSLSLSLSLSLALALLFTFGTFCFRLHRRCRPWKIDSLFCTSKPRHNFATDARNTP